MEIIVQIQEDHNNQEDFSNLIYNFHVMIKINTNNNIKINKYFKQDIQIIIMKNFLKKINITDNFMIKKIALIKI